MDNRIKIYNEMMNSKSFIKTYTRLVANAGVKEALVVGNLASMQKHYVNKRKLDSKGYFFSTYETIAKNTGLTQKQVISAVKSLEDRKLILSDPRPVKGVTIKYYRVNHRMVNRYLTNEYDLILLGSFIELQNYYDHKYYKDEKEKAKFIDEDGFFKCSFEKLIANTGLDEAQVKAIVKDLEEKEFINSKTTKKVINDKKTGELVTITYYWYKVDLKKASEYLLNIPGKESENIIADDYEDEDGSTKGSFFMAKKKIAQKLDPVSAIIFADIWTSFMKAVDENTLTEDEWFYVLQDKISSRTGISRKTICRKYLPILKKIGLIDMEAKGFPLKTYIRINFDAMDKILEINTSSSNEVIYVEKESDGLKELTQNLINYAEEISGIKWDFDYYKVACINDVMSNIDVTEEQLKKVIDRQYIYYKDRNKLDKMFTFANIIGQPSKVVGWLKAIESDKEDAAILEKAKEVTESICEAIEDYTNGDVIWKADSNKSDIIRKVLLWEENFNEEDLIKHAKARYDWCKDNNKKMTAFYKLFSKDEKDNITNSKKQKQYKKSRNYDCSKKVDSLGRSCDKHGVSCTPVSKEGLEFQDKMREAGEVY